MQPTRPLRQFVYGLALTTILLSQQIASQTQPATPLSAPSPTASSPKPNAGGVKCTANGTYVNNKARLFRDRRIAPVRRKVPRLNVEKVVTVSAKADVERVHITVVSPSGFRQP